MAEDNEIRQDTNVADAQSSDVTTLDALHLDGKGAERLDDAEENELPDAAASDGEDVKAFANVQSANRNTFEDMQQGAPDVRGATPTGGQVISDVYTPSEPDNTVAVQFQNPFPAFSPDLATEAPEEQPAARDFGPVTDEQPIADQILPGPVVDDAERQGEQAAPIPAPAAEVIPTETPTPTTPPTDPFPTQAQAPLVTTTDASGIEDQLTKLNISAAVNDTDGGGDRLTSLTISGIPEGFIITDANGNPLGTVTNGTWTLTNVTAQTLDNIYLKNLDSDDDADFSGDFTLSISVTASEGGSNATTTVSLPVHIEAVADTPVLGVHDSAGMENTWIPLDIDVTSKDQDGSEYQTVYITDLPTGAQLRYTDSDGNVVTVAATSDTLPNGLPAGTYYKVPAEYLDSLEVQAATNNSTDFHLTVYAASTEKMNGDTAVSAPQTIEVDVGLVQPLVSGSGTGNEDQFADLTLSAQIDAKDGGETMVGVYIEDLPTGVILRDSNGTVLTPTTYTDENGVTHTRYDVTGYWDSATGSVNGLQVGWDTSAAATTHLDDDIDFKLRAVVKDGDTDTDSAAVQSAAPDVNENVTDVHVTIKAVADAPTLSGSAIGVEDQAIPLNIDAGLVDQDGSETLSVYVTGVPDGATLSAGTKITEAMTLDDGKVIPAGSYLLTVAELNGLTITAPQDSDTDFNLTVTAVATETGTDDQVATRTAGTQITVPVQVLSDADKPTVAVDDQTFVINEDAWFNLQGHVSSATTEVAGDSSESITDYVITATEESRVSVNGVVTILQAGEKITVSASDVTSGKVLVGGVSNWASDDDNPTLTFQIQSVTTEANGSADETLADENGLTRSTTAISDPDTLTLTVKAVADAPNLVATDAIAVEDKEFALNISASVTDTDGSETITAIYITGVPDGATLSAGTKITEAVTLDDGKVIPAGSYVLTVAQLSGLKMTAPEDSDVDFTLKVTAVSSETGSDDLVTSKTAGTTSDLHVQVLSDADKPTVAVDDQTFVINEDSWFNLQGHVSGATTEVTGDSSESITDYVITATADSRVSVNGVVTILQAGEKITVSASDVTSGKVLVGGVSNWASDDDNPTLTFQIQSVTTEANGSADETLADENGLTRSTTAISDPDTLTLTVKAVADAPNLVATDAIAVEDKEFALNISASVTDTDGSETITAIYITGVPDGATLSAGTKITEAVTLDDGKVIPAGSYVLTVAQLSGLKMTAPEDSDVDFTLKVTAVSSETGSDDLVTSKTAGTTSDLHVQVLSDADKPTVAVDDQTFVINEDSWFNLQGHVSGATTEVTGDSSESITDYVITATADSRVSVNGVVTELKAGETITVSASDVASGKVLVGGVSNWASSSSTPTLTFEIQSVTTEANGSTDAAIAAANNLTRSTTALSDKDTLTLTVTPVADETHVSSVAAGNEDQAGGIPFNPTITLTDADGSETLTGTVDILVAQGSMDGHFEYDGQTLAATSTVTIDGVTYDVYSIAVSDLSHPSTATYTVQNLVYVPETDSDKDFTYRVRTTTSDTDNSSTYTTTTSTATLVVKAVADAPIISVDGQSSGTIAITGNEDSAIRLNLDAQLKDTDGSETITGAVLENVPQGWTVAYVDNNGNVIGYATHSGTSTTWVLDLNTYDASQVALIPPTNSDADATGISFKVTTTEHAGATSGDIQTATATATSTVTFNVVVNAVADQPNLVVTDARVVEDHVVKLDIRPALTDTDGSEVLTVTIGNVPTGASFVDAAGNAVGTYDSATGTWSFTSAQLSNLYFKPAANSNEDAQLTITAVSTETSNGSTATRTATLNVIVTGDADVPYNPTTGSVIHNGDVLTATGTEDQLINPNLTAYHSLDTDGSESLSVVISGIPEGVSVVMVADANGQDTSQYLKYIGVDSSGNPVYSVAPEYVEYVRFSTPANYSGTFDVSVRLISTENDGDFEKVDTTLQVTVNPVVDTPSGSISGSGKEDGGSRTDNTGTSIAITLHAAVGDTGGGNSTIGAGGAESVVSVGNLTADVTDMVTKVIANGGSASDVYIEYNGTRYEATSDGNGHYVIEIGSIDIDDATDGVEVTYTNGSATSVDISGLTLHGVPTDYSKDVSVSFEVVTRDGSSVSDPHTVTGSVTIAAVADAPLISIADNAGDPLSAGAIVGYDETGSTHTVTLQGVDGAPLVQAAETDGSETLYLVLGGVPNGISVVAYDHLGNQITAYNNGGGSWTLPAGVDVSSIKLVATELSDTDLNNDGTYGDTATITIKTVVTDHDYEGGTDTYTSDVVTVQVDFGTFSGSGGGGTLPPIPEGHIVGGLTITEDNSFSLADLHIVATSTTNGVTTTVYDSATESDGVGSDGSTISVVVVIPEGWAISGSGYYLVSTDAATGSATYTVPYSALSSVTITPPDDYSGKSSDLEMKVVATTADGRYDETASALAPVPVTILPDADAAAISVNIGTVVEDSGAQALTLTIQAGDTDGSESLTSDTVTIRIYDQDGHSPGTLSGTDVTVTGTGNGYTEYSVTLSASQMAAFTSGGSVLVSGLTFTPATNYSGSIKVDVSVGVTDSVTIDGTQYTDTDTTTQTTTITVTPDVDDSVIHAQPVTGAEDTAITLDVTIDHSDLVKSGTTYSSETMNVVISGVPTGVTLVGAYNNGDGTWTVKDANLVYNADGTVSLSGVSVIPATDSSVDFTLTVTTYAKEADGSTWEAVTSSPFQVTVTAVTDGGSINPQNVSGTEDVRVALDLGAQILDSTESATITITGVPAGAAITDADGNEIGTKALQADGTYTWTLSASVVTAQGLLSGGTVYFSGPANVAGTWTLGTSISVQDLDSGDANPNPGAVVTSGTSTFTVTLAADADMPVLTSSNSSGDEDSKIALNLSAVQNTDTDGSETLTVTITGAPVGTVFYTASGAVISATVVNGVSQWVIPANSGGLSVDGLQMQTPHDYNGTVTLTVTATSTEGTSTATTTAQTITVTVNPTNDAPVVDITAGVGIGTGSHHDAITLLDSSASISITDVDDTTLSKVTVSIGHAQAGDTLGLTGLTLGHDANGNLTTTLSDGTVIAISYDDGVLTLSGSATPDQYETLLHSVIFTSSTGTLTDGMREVTVTAYDGSGATGSDDITVTVTGTATVSGDAYGDVYFSNDGTAHLAASADSAIHPLDDLDIAGTAASTTLSGMAVHMDGAGFGDTLALAGQDVTVTESGTLLIKGTDISVSYDGQNHTLVFSGTADAETYETLAKSVVLSNSDGTIDAGTRDFTVTVFDDQNTASTLTASTALNTGLTLAGDGLGDVRWGTDGSATVDDTLIVQYGDNVNYINGGLGGTDTLVVQNNGHEADWTFNVDNTGVVHATSTSDATKSFEVHMNQGSTATVSTDGDSVVFNGDASGQITFHDGTTLQFDNMERLMG